MSIGEATTPAVGEGDDPLALLVYTSGSTGTPKGAMYPETKAHRRGVRRRRLLPDR